MGKGVPREGESEGSPMQKQRMTNRNQIVGHSNLGKGAMNPEARKSLKGWGVNLACAAESSGTYPGRSASRERSRSQQRP